MISSLPLTVANPLPVYYEIDMIGGILPNNSTSLYIENAEVSLEIDSTHFLEVMIINFSGAYTIYNPNSTIETMLGAPFTLANWVLDLNYSVSLNGSLIPYETDLIGMNHSELWDIYLEDYYFYTRLLICNVTIPENETVIVTYNLGYSMKNPLYNLNTFSIRYDVGTARAWNGTITEIVEFNVRGKLPNDHYFKESCSITNTVEGRSYTWEWIDETIEINYVGISYSGRLISLAFYAILFSIIGVIPLLTIGIISLRRRKKKRSEF